MTAWTTSRPKEKGKGSLTRTEKRVDSIPLRGFLAAFTAALQPSPRRAHDRAIPLRPNRATTAFRF